MTVVRSVVKNEEGPKSGRVTRPCMSAFCTTTGGGASSRDPEKQNAGKISSTGAGRRSRADLYQDMYHCMCILTLYHDINVTHSVVMDMLGAKYCRVHRRQFRDGNSDSCVRGIEGCPAVSDSSSAVTQCAWRLCSDHGPCGETRGGPQVHA
jgi:hypothetical protein